MELIAEQNVVSLSELEMFKPLHLKLFLDYWQSDKPFAAQMIVSGGAAKHIFDRHSPYSDVDVYILGEFDGCELQSSIRDYFRDCLRNSVNPDVRNASIDFERIKNAPTLKLKGCETDLQLITFRKIDSVQELLQGFDFTCCQFALSRDGQLFYTPEAAEAQEKKVLVWTEHAINNEWGYDLESRFWRIQKYLFKGYSFGEGQGDMFFKMPWAESKKSYARDGARSSSSGSNIHEQVGTAEATPWDSSQALVFDHSNNQATTLDHAIARRLLDEITNIPPPPLPRGSRDINPIQGVNF